MDFLRYTELYTVHMYSRSWEQWELQRIAGREYVCGYCICLGGCPHRYVFSPPTLSDKNIDWQEEVYPLSSLFSLEHKWKNKITEGSREGSNIFMYTEQDFPIKTQTDKSNSCEKNGPFSSKGWCHPDMDPFHHLV